MPRDNSRALEIIDGRENICGTVLPSVPIDMLLSRGECAAIWKRKATAKDPISIRGTRMGQRLLIEGKDQ